MDTLYCFHLQKKQAQPTEIAKPEVNLDILVLLPFIKRMLSYCYTMLLNVRDCYDERNLWQNSENLNALNAELGD